MATREKKPRSVNSDSPTPSLGGGSDSAPSTPTSKGKGGRASLSRQKSKQLLQSTNEDSVQSTDDIADPPAATESAANTSGSSSNKSTSGSRTTRATTNEPTESASSSKEKEKDKDDAKDSKTTRQNITKKKKPAAAGGSNTDKSKTSVTAIKKTALLKRKTRPIVGKPVLGKKVIARKQVTAKGKKEVTVTLKEDDSKNKNLRNGKPRATDSPVSKKKPTPSKDKAAKDSPTVDPTVTVVKQERRRSDSVSKCSDVTDASTTLDTSSAKDDDDKKDDTSLSDIKRELLLEESETKSKILDKMAEAFNERKTPTILPSAKDEKAVRRSARQRKSTPKEKEGFATPTKIKAPVEIKSEPMDTDDSESAAAAPLTIDTAEVPVSKETPSSELLEKDSSLSPELVSEGVSEISVKEFYSEPAFLENNLGIEKDPKLGEIVQVQEKIKLDKGSDSEASATAVATASSNGSASVVKEEIQQVVVKEELKEEDENKDGEKMKNEKQHSETTMGVEKLKEIIGVVEPSKVVQSSVVVAPPVVVIPKEEGSGNESPLSDRSNDKDVLLSIINKVESSLKKSDSRSDSEGERTAGKSKAKGAAKEPKPKARNAKDKCKEDEKAKEEKLRQEKLRVEEKVREEKLRAERLKQEEEKKIIEEKIKQEQESKKVVPAAVPEVTSKPTSPKTIEEVVSVLEKVLPTKTVTTLSLTSADSHLVLSVTSSEASDVVESKQPEPLKLEQIVSNAITLENLPAITLLKKDPNQVKDETKHEALHVKAELEILPLKEVAVAKEEISKQKGSESPLQIISKSENAAAAVAITTVTAEGNKSPLSIIAIQTDKGSDKSAIFEEIPEQARKATDIEAVQNRDREQTTDVSHPPEELKTVALNDTHSVPNELPSVSVSEPARKSTSLAYSAPEMTTSEDVDRQKESHFKHLGLLTLQAASEEKQRRKELVLHKPTGGTSMSSAISSCSSTSSTSSKSGSGGTKSTRNSESTGTLKTVIKLNRGEKRKPRLPLKMTLQKGKGKGAEKDANGGEGNGETAFYIIQSEADHQNQSMTDSSTAQGSAALGRKAHSRSHTTDVVTVPEVAAESAVVKEVVQQALVIPEKASSFNVHPERLCQDQCFYCGGKFGLYDTPCHIAAMKSSERQQNILASEVKIKIDSCLCDACFRHVDRKANCPSYRKKTEAKSLSSLARIQSSVNSMHNDKPSQDEVLGSASAPSLDNSQSSGEEALAQRASGELEIVEEKILGICHVQSCNAGASHTIRRKWLLKMKKTINKILEINLEQTNAVSNLIPICDGHYELISHLMICAMCKRRLPKNHIYYIVNEIPQLERLIQEQGIAMKLGNSTLVVCKLCRYYANLLLKPPDAKSQKAQFIKNYNRRLLQFYERENELQELALSSMEPTQIVSNPDIIISDGEDDSIEIVPVVGESVSLQRRSHHSRKSTDLTIVDTNNSANKMGELEEVTITPAPKLQSTANISGNSSIILDADVSIEQQQPPASAEKRRKDESIDMTKALKANPNISMRELFPGEEELGIHINIPFNNASTRTPEGWLKVNTTIQYDDSTRALWEELQKPYGNQSSFLRHLVLLEKYFRNGDLILSPQAKNNAATYSEAVQNRLRSFDNVPTPPPVAVIDKSSLLQQLQQGNAPITITPTAAKARTKSSTEPVSLLKSNNPHLVGGSSSSSSSSAGEASLKRKLSADAKTKTPLAGKSDVPPGSKVMKLDETIVVPGGKASVLVPPELISINAKQNVTITTIPPGKTPSTSIQGPPPPPPLQPQPQPQQQQSLLQPQQSLLQPQSQNKKSPGSAGMREIIKLPDQLTEAERRETSKPWRPTLIPITPGSAETIKAGPLYQTADGRRLPKLVQVMSGGKPYHISIHDYNRMCILRREKLLQQRQDLMQHQLQQQQKRLQQQSPPSLASLNTNVTKTAAGAGKSLLDTNAMNASKMAQQIPNQILEQNSLIPIGNNSSGSANNATNNNINTPLNKPNGPSSELQQLIKLRKPGSSNSLIPPVTSGPTYFKNTLPLSTATSKPLPISLPNAPSLLSMAGVNHQHQQLQSGVQPTNTTSPSVVMPSGPSQLDQLIKSNNSFLNNFLTQSQLTAMVAAATAMANSANNSNSLLTTGGGGGSGSSGGSILMDNSAAQLLSKIPKSLTVIPQQKQRSLSRVSSNEDQSSA